MAELEAEVLLLGIWRNVADLEESLSLPELQAILEAAREKEHREHKFLAALKGIDLDEGKKEETQDAFDRIKQRAEARLRGVSEEEVGRQADAELFGLEFEVED